MAVRLLSHAHCPAATSTPASRTSSSRVFTALSPARPAPPSISTSSKQPPTVSTSTSPSPTDKVLCGCGAVSNDGKPMVECVKCGTWSHLQCARLTKRTARKLSFLCHRCKISSVGPATLASRRKGVVFVGGISKGLSKSNSALRQSKSSIQPSRPTSLHPHSSISTTLNQSFISEPISVSSTSHSQTTVSASYSQPIVSAPHPRQPVSGNNVLGPNNVPIVCSTATDVPHVNHEDSNPIVSVVGLRSEMEAKLTKLESAIRTELKVRILSLEEVSNQ